MLLQALHDPSEREAEIAPQMMDPRALRREVVGSRRGRGLLQHRKSLVEAIRHPGFSFVEILSPCVTFRPDEKDWKNLVHPAPVAATSDPGKAARRIMTDDGFNIGILYRGDRRPYQPGIGCASAEPSEPERDFEL